jgi:hypothetical protein
LFLAVGAGKPLIGFEAARPAAGFIRPSAEQKHTKKNSEPEGKKKTQRLEEIGAPFDYRSRLSTADLDLVQGEHRTAE